MHWPGPRHVQMCAGRPQDLWPLGRTGGRLHNPAHDLGKQALYMALTHVTTESTFRGGQEGRETDRGRNEADPLGLQHYQLG